MWDIVKGARKLALIELAISTAILILAAYSLETGTGLDNNYAKEPVPFKGSYQKEPIAFTGSRWEEPIVNGGTYRKQKKSPDTKDSVSGLLIGLLTLIYTIFIDIELIKKIKKIERNGATSRNNIASTTAYEGPFIASAKLNSYHRPSCIAIKKIKSANQIAFLNSDDAKTAGYSPCKKCLPL